jgi:hypothetical protein
MKMRGATIKMPGIIAQYGLMCSFRQIFVKVPISNLTKFLLVGAVFIYAERRIDGQTDGWKETCDITNSLFRYLCESAP